MRSLVKPQYIVFVPDADVDEDTLSFYEVLDWGWQHLNHPNVMHLSEDDVYFLYYQTEVLNIVNDENNSMVSVSEDDAVYDNDIKIRICERVKAYLAGLSPKSQFKDPLGLERAQRLTLQLLRLMEVSISSSKSIHFRF